MIAARVILGSLAAMALAISALYVIVAKREIDYHNLSRRVCEEAMVWARESVDLLTDPPASWIPIIGISSDGSSDQPGCGCWTIHRPGPFDITGCGLC